ncbi:hypothetical protein QQ045_010207 [Rhodiola kirilowii]
MGDGVMRCSPDDGWRVEFSNCEGGWARVMLLWYEATTKILNIQKFYHFVAYEVKADNKRFGLIVMYASNIFGEEIVMWEEIEKIEEKFSGSWLCIGDLNYDKDQTEKINGNRVSDKDTADFRRFLAITDLVDFPASGCHFTWSNNHINPYDRIWSKLDRALGNSVWFEEMEEAHAKFLSPSISDHSPVVVYWGQEERIIKSFRYCNFWDNLEEYEDIIRSIWSCGNKCKNLFMIQAKLKYMKHIMKQRFVGSTRGMDKRVNQTREALLEAQRKSESKPQDAECCNSERKMAMEFRKIKYNQFLFNKQRTKAQWIIEGDANTKFFHSLLKSRSRNNIIQVSLGDGTVSTDRLIIKQELSKYFKELLGHERVCSNVKAKVVAQGPSVNSVQCKALVREATDKEIWAALNNIRADKAS